MVVLTNTKGDVERHRVCDKHIIKVAEPSPAVTVLNLSTRGLLSIIVMVPSDQPQIWESDTTMTTWVECHVTRLTDNIGRMSREKYQSAMMAN